MSELQHVRKRHVPARVERRSYEVIDPETGNRGRLELNPSALASNPQTLAVLSLLICLAADREELSAAETSLLSIAMDRHAVTNDEALTAFWRAYSDPYVSRGMIEFRHLWKYISEMRNQGRLFTYAEAVAEKTPGVDFSLEFEPVKSGEDDERVLFRRRR